MRMPARRHRLRYAGHPSVAEPSRDEHFRCNINLSDGQRKSLADPQRQMQRKLARPPSGLVLRIPVRVLDNLCQRRLNNALSL